MGIGVAGGAMTNAWGSGLVGKGNGSQGGTIATGRQRERRSHKPMGREGRREKGGMEGWREEGKKEESNVGSCREPR
jgi:hypothetical protein